MRIGIDGRLLISIYNFRGMATYTFRLLDYLIEYEPDNEYFLFVNKAYKYNISPQKYNKRLESYIKHKNCKLININASNAFMWEQVYLPIKIKKLKLDVMHMTANRAPFFCPCKLVVTVHDLIELVYFKDFYRTSKGLRGKFYDLRAGGYIKFMYKKIFHRADRIITVSKSSRTDLNKTLNISESKISVIYHGYDKSFRRLNFSKENYILCLGCDMEYKNTDSVIKAYCQLPEKLKQKFSLKIVGDCPRVRKTVSESKEPNIIIEKFDFTKPLAEKYNKAQVFVFVSFYEGFGMPVLEAMACGTPVIASNRTSLPEVVKDAGIIVDPASIKEIKNAMLAVLIDEPLRNKLIYNSLLRVKDFSWKIFGKKHYKAYKS